MAGTAVFPWLGSYGYETADGYNYILHRFPDGTYRRYLLSPFDDQERVVNFDAVKQQIKTDVTQFFNDRMSSTNDYEFIFYDPELTSSIDSSGLTSVGAFKAIFDPDQGGGTVQRNELRWTRVGRCRWSAKIRILLLAPVT